MNKLAFLLELLGKVRDQAAEAAGDKGYTQDMRYGFAQMGVAVGKIIYEFEAAQALNRELAGAAPYVADVSTSDGYQ